MKAVYIKEFGGAENLEIRDVENPESPQNCQVSVSVKASALNRADIVQRLGKYPAPKGYPQKIPGLEFAGTVTETGKDIKNFKTGDRVFGITAGGAQAEFLLTDESVLAKIPDNLTFTEAAAIPEAFMTAHDAVFTQGNLKKGETLLIHAVGSGVGLAALQLAKARGNTVIGTSRTKSKLEKCSEFGLDQAIETSSPESLTEKLKSAGGVDLVLDLVGAVYFQANIEALNTNGRIVFIGTTGGVKAELNIFQVMAKRAKLIGSVLRSRSLAEKAEVTQKFIGEVLPLLESGKIKPNIDRIFRLEDIQAAHEYLESNESFGKVVLEI